MTTLINHFNTTSADDPTGSAQLIARGVGQNKNF